MTATARISFLVLLVRALFFGSGPALLGAPPEQFRVWGTAGKETPPLPSGWTVVESEPEELPTLVPSREERQRGFVLFACDPLQPVDSAAVPAAAGRTAELRSYAARGEYEAVFLGIHAVEDLAGIQVAVSELRSVAGGVIPEDHLDLRIVRSVPVVADRAARTCRLQPFLLEKRPSFSLPKAHSAVCWLTFQVPKDAPPGEYRGTWSIVRPNQPAARISLAVNVLPFVLPELPVEATLYYPRPAESEAMLLRELIDLREHGASVPIPAMEARIRSRDRKFGPDDVAETKAYCRRLLGALRQVYGSWRFPATFEVGHQIAYYWDRDWFSYWPHSPDIEADLGTAIRLVQDLAKADGVPSLRAYFSDEAGAHNLLEEAVYYNRWIKDHCPGLATTATIGGGLALGHDEIGQLSGVVDFLSANRFTPEIATALVARRKPFGVYNGAGPTPAGARFFFGFYGRKTGAQQLAQWAYSFGECVFTGNGLRQEDEGYVYHAPDGPLPSLMWEAVRAGIDDGRYVELLDQMILAAKASSQAPARAAAQQAEDVLAGIWSRIGWTFQALQSGDCTPPPHPSTLRKWRTQVAGQIQLLQPHLGPAAPLPVTTPGSPLAVPWAKPAKDAATYGAELLPPADFEAGWKPWRVEAWKGRGHGALDTKERRRGRPVARLDVPPDDGDSAVTVLVWPQYGENRLNLTLEGGRAYEFSAWAKWRDRALPPELRVNLPGNVATTQTGRDEPAPDGWQRLWLRTELKAAAQPSYLAVWVQGPGTVWLHDLSLREVIPPPLRASLDQEQYDALDHLAVLSATVGGQTKPAALRCTLARVTGECLAVQTVPFHALHQEASDGGTLTCLVPFRAGSVRFVFDPSVLKPGGYQARLELLDSEGRSFAAQTIPWQREADLSF